MPDLFHWMLTGEQANELTIASTTQLYNPRTGNWSEKLIERFGLPREIFGRIVPPGTTLGPLLRHVAEETGLKNVKVVLAGVARYGKRGAGRARIVRWLAGSEHESQLVLHQLRHVVAHGRRNARAGDQRRLRPLELHQRRRRRRHDAAAEKHHGPVARAGVPAHLEVAAARTTTGRASPGWPPRPRRCAASSTPTIRGWAPRRTCRPRSPRCAANRPAGARRSRRRHPLRLESLALKYRAGARLSGAAQRRADQADPHRRRRHAESAAVPDGGRRLRPAGRSPGPIEATAIGNVHDAGDRRGRRGGRAPKRARSCARASTWSSTSRKGDDRWDASGGAVCEAVMRAGAEPPV